jgi:hypothetical protein
MPSTGMSWLSLSGPASQMGSGVLSFSIAANAGPARVGTIDVGSQVLTVTQGAGDGSLHLYPASQIIPSGGTTDRSLKVVATGPWSVMSAASWIVPQVTSGSGNGSIGYTVSPNTAASPRTGTVTVGGATFTVFQDGQSTLVHPRLWLDPNDVGIYRARATSSNPIWQNGLAQALAAAEAYANPRWNWTAGKPSLAAGGGSCQNIDNRNDSCSGAACVGGACSSWNDPGVITWPGDPTEAYAELFAFGSLVHPDASKRAQYASMARAMLMWMMNQANGAHDNNVPFRQTEFGVYDRTRIYGEGFGLTIDWIYPTLTAADKATIQNVLMLWSGDLINGYYSPQPLYATNSTDIIKDNIGTRGAANNYSLGHFRQLALFSHVMDPVDDPVNTNWSSVSKFTRLADYAANATGARLYRIYALFEHADIVASAYGINAADYPNLGLASGGLPVEGCLYGESLAFFAEGLWALATTGADDPAVAGPQAAMVESGYWDRMTAGFVSNIAPTPASLPGALTSQPVYMPASYGDNLTDYVTGDYIGAFASEGLFSQRLGYGSRYDGARWIASNTFEGGMSGLYAHANGNFSADNGGGTGSDAVQYFMLLDPSQPAPVDPRPSLPTVFEAPDIGRVLARTDWTANASWFTSLSHWETIDHQDGDSGQIELYRKGEWLTKEWSNYDNNFYGQTPAYRNSLLVKNDTPSNVQFYEVAFDAWGGQWNHAENAGDPTNQASYGPGYVFVFNDLTPLYNVPLRGANDVHHVSRSAVWLSPDHVVVYDRAETGKTGRAKSFNLNLTANPSISGHVATMTTPGGQLFYVNSLLPATPTSTMVETHKWTSDPSEEMNPVAWGCPDKYRLVVEDTAGPAAVRFLHVLQGANMGTAMTASSVLKSTSSPTFEGAVVGHVAVLFPHDPAAASGTLTYTVPSSVAGHVITGLTPNAQYAVAISGNQVTVSAGTTHTADKAGVLVVGSPTP